MAEQIVDLRAAGAALRRHAGLIMLVGLLGAVLGAGVPLVRPPMFTSTSEVLLPTPTVVQGQQPDTETQIEIAESPKVLGAAGRIAAPELSFRQLGKRVVVSGPSAQTLSFEAKAPTAAQAKKLATALSQAEVRYAADVAAQDRGGGLRTTLDTLKQDVSELQTAVRGAKGADSPAATTLSAQLATLTGQLETLSATTAPVTGTATILQPASTPERPNVVGTYLVPVAGGLLAGLLLAGVVVLLLARVDRRLRRRDQFAATIGSPVVATFRGRTARAIGGWHHLLAAYEPNPVDAWALRRVLREVPTGADGRRTVTIVGAESDHRGLALGPLLASYAASVGIGTELVVDTAAPTTSLTVAIRRAAGTEMRPGLHVAGGEPSAGADLTVVVTVATTATIATPPASDPVREDSPVLVGLAAGAVTAKQAAQAAMTADTLGRLVGVVVVDPDVHDHAQPQIGGSARPGSVGLARVSSQKAALR